MHPPDLIGGIIVHLVVLAEAAEYVIAGRFKLPELVEFFEGSVIGEMRRLHEVLLQGKSVIFKADAHVFRWAHHIFDCHAMFSCACFIKTIFTVMARGLVSFVMPFVANEDVSNET